MNHSKQLIRFTTAGNVDDGKSTLIGRLLYDSKALFQDQMRSVEKASKNKGINKLDLSFFTDGLKEERELGITIDVAYRYFSTPKRKFIIADAPGHEEFTRNMITAASTANAAVILIDATKGVKEQTKRHAFIASLLQIPHVIVCVNKMDLVDYSEKHFDTIQQDFEAFSSKLLIRDIRFIPVCALNGDNIVSASNNLPWYQGAPLLNTLESLTISSDINKVDTRFVVQGITETETREGVSICRVIGRLNSGILREDEEIVVLPSGAIATISSLYNGTNETKEGIAPMSLSLVLKEKLAIQRGDMIVKPNNQPKIIDEFEAFLCWLGKTSADINSDYILQHTTKETEGQITEVLYKFNVNTLERKTKNISVQMNDLVKVKVKLSTSIMADMYRVNRITGSFILIDKESNETVAAGMIV